MYKNYLLLLLFLFSGCAVVEIPKEMMYLDQAYVPVWLACEDSQLEVSEDRLTALENKWMQFIQQYNDFFDASEDNRETLRLLQEWFQDLNYCLAEKDDYCVRVKLDQFKFELQELRTFWDLEYTLDYVWDFEASVAQFMAIAEDPKLHLFEWNEFMEYVRSINESWERLKNHQPDAIFLEWDKEKSNNYTLLINDLSYRLDCLNGLTEGAQAQELATCSNELHQQVKQLIALFGIFPPSHEIHI